MSLPILRVLITAAAAVALQAQTPGTCSCGADPPGPPKDREVRPYANTPEDMRPYGNFAAPYYEFYQKQVEYNGAARDVPTREAAGRGRRPHRFPGAGGEPHR